MALWGRSFPPKGRFPTATVWCKLTLLLWHPDELSCKKCKQSVVNFQTVPWFLSEAPVPQTPRCWAPGLPSQVDEWQWRPTPHAQFSYHTPRQNQAWGQNQTPHECLSKSTAQTQNSLRESKMVIKMNENTLEFDAHLQIKYIKLCIKI